jgi:hypothetical protein
MTCKIAFSSTSIAIYNVEILSIYVSGCYTGNLSISALLFDSSKSIVGQIHDPPFSAKISRSGLINMWSIRAKPWRNKDIYQEELEQ